MIYQYNTPIVYIYKSNNEIIGNKRRFTMASEKKIDYVLLGMLSHEGLTGYDIKKRFEQRFKFFYNASFGSIYPALAKLEEEGMIVSKSLEDNGRERIVYTITEEGKQTLCSWLEKPVIKDELRYETLIKLFFGKEVGADVTIKHIKEFQMKIQNELQFLKGCAKQLEKHSEDSTHLYYLLTVNFGVKSYESYLEWCDEAINILEGTKENE
jgi:DNA-binding PadR family transcriptional regulator